MGDSKQDSMDNQSQDNDQNERLLDSAGNDPEINDIDELIEKAGGFGKMQWLMVGFAAIGYQGINFFIYTLAFLELMPKLQCRPTIESDWAQCEAEYMCKNYGIEKRDINWQVNFDDSESFHNWMTDLNLFCYSDFLIGLLGSIYFVGFAINGLILKQADRFGRRNLIIVGCFAQLGVTFGLFFSRSLYLNYFLLFLAGLFVAKNITVYILCTEICPKKYQVYVGSFCLTIDPVMVLIPVSLYFYFGGTRWNHILILALAFAVLACIVCFFIPESPRYLYSKKRWMELRSNLRTISKVNGVNMGEDYLIDEQVVEENKRRKLNTKSQMASVDEVDETVPDLDVAELESDENEDESGEFSVLRALKNPTTSINFVAVIICFCVVSFNYYMISFYMKYVGGNIFINTLAATISEGIGNFAAGFIQKAFGTKKAFVICFVCGIIFALPLLFFTNVAIIAVSVFSSKFFVEGAFLIAYYVNSEIFHPLFVPFSFSVCGFASRTVTIAAPQVAELKPRQVPVIIFLICSGIACFSALLLRKPKERAKSIKSLTSKQD